MSAKRMSLTLPSYTMKHNIYLWTWLLPTADRRRLALNRLAFQMAAFIIFFLLAELQITM